MTVAANTIDIGSIITALGPTFWTIAGGVWAAASPIFIAKINARLKAHSTQQQWDVVKSAADWGANFVWAQAEPSIAKAQIRVGNPAVAMAAKMAVEKIPLVLKVLGVTPELFEKEMETLIIGALGAKQAAVASSPAQVLLETVKTAA